MTRTKFFVVDTNVLVSAFIIPKSVAGMALTKARKYGSILMSAATASELSEVLIRPKFDRYLPLQIREEIINDFLSLASFAEPAFTITACRDPKDDKFLELACSADTTCIISGDKTYWFYGNFAVSR